MKDVSSKQLIAPRVAVHGLNLESNCPRIIKHSSMIVCFGILSSSGVDRSWQSASEGVLLCAAYFKMISSCVNKLKLNAKKLMISFKLQC